MAVLASDNFNRADENPLGSPWVDPGFSGAPQLLSNAFNGTNSDGGVYYDGGITWPADHYSTLKLKTAHISESDSQGGPMCCVQAGAASGYIFGVGGGAWTLKKFTAGSLGAAFASTVIAGAVPAGVTANGMMTIGRQGNDIIGWLDGVEIVRGTDTTFAGGAPGLYKWPNSAVGYDDWEGGDFAAGDTTPPTITSTGTGTSPTFGANAAENSTAACITLTASENVTWGALGGADAAAFQKINVTATTVQIAPVAGFNFEALPHANPQVVTVAATDGSGNATTVTVNVTIINVAEPPNAPVIGTATAGDATVTINGTAGAANGGPGVTSYTATLSPGSITKAGASLPIVFGSGDGVVNGTAYTGTLTATNSEGTGPASAASNSVTPSAGGGGVKVPAVLLSRLLTPRS